MPENEKILKDYKKDRDEGKKEEKKQFINVVKSEIVK